MNKRLTKISKYLTFVLRHKPESIGLVLDGERWASIEELVTKANNSGKTVTLAQVEQIVALNELDIFEVSDDRRQIRAK